MRGVRQLDVSMTTRKRDAAGNRRLRLAHEKLGVLVRTAGTERRGDRPFHNGRSVRSRTATHPGNTWDTSSITDAG